MIKTTQFIVNNQIVNAVLTNFKCYKATYSIWEILVISNIFVIKTPAFYYKLLADVTAGEKIGGKNREDRPASDVPAGDLDH